MKIRLLFPCVHRVMDSGGCSRVLFCGCIILSKGFIIFYTNFSIWVVLLLCYCMVSVVSISKCLRDMQGEMPARTKYCKYQTEQAGRGSFLQVLYPSNSSLKQSSLQLCRKWDSVHYAHKLIWAGQQAALSSSGMSRYEAFFSTQ